MRTLILLLAFLVTIPVFGQRRKKGEEQPIQVTSATADYTFPQKGIRLFVTVVKEKFAPGPYANYAEQMLGIKEVKRNGYEKWVIKNIDITTFVEPNQDKIFTARGLAASMINLSENGCLIGINANSDVMEDEAEMVTNNYITDLNLNDGFNFDYITDTPFYLAGDSTNNFALRRVTSEQKAKEASKRVLDARLAQYDIAAGMLDGLPPDGEAYKTSIYELREIEEKYLSLFAGRTTHSTHHFSFNYVPKKQKEEVVFRFSSNNGVVAASDFSGKPVTVRVITRKLGDGQSDANQAGTTNLSNCYYVLPAVGDILVQYDLKTIASSRAVFPQLGKLVPIVDELLDGNYSIELYPTTGGLKSIKKR